MSDSPAAPEFPRFSRLSWNQLRSVGLTPASAVHLDALSTVYLAALESITRAHLELLDRVEAVEFAGRALRGVVVHLAEEDGAAIQTVLDQAGQEVAAARAVERALGPDPRAALAGLAERFTEELRKFQARPPESGASAP